MDISTLGIRVDSQEAAGAAQDLDKLTDSARKTDTQVDKLGGTTGKTSKVMEEMQRRVERATSSFGGFMSGIGGMATGLMGLLGAGVGIKVLQNMVDAWSDVSSRVGVAIGNMDEAEGVMDKLSRTARLTYSSLSQTADGFVRNSTVLQALGKTTQEQIQYTEALNLALVASGTKGERALAVQEALSKGMTNGKLAIEQLQTVMNGSAEVAKALADELGTTVLGLGAMASQGKITGDVIFNALTQRLEEFTTKAEEMPATIGDGFLLIANSLTSVIGKFDQWAGTSSYVASALIGVADGITWVGDNIGTLIGYIQPLLPLMVATFGPLILSHVMALAAAIVGPLLSAVTSLFVLLAANPITAVVGAIVLVMSYMVDWEQSIHALINAWAIFVASWKEFWGDEAGAKRTIEIAINAKQAVSDMLGAGEKIRATIEKGFNFGGATAAPHLTNAMDRGGKIAAGHIEGAMAVTAQRAEAIWESLNGKVVQPLGQVLMDGGKYIYNQVTGAIELAADKAGQKVKSEVIQGGETAGASIKQQMVSAGSQVGGDMFSTLARIGDVWSNSLQKTMGDVINTMMRQQILLMQSQAAKNWADADAAARGGKGGSGGGSGDGGGLGTQKNGRPKGSGFTGKTYTSKSGNPMGPGWMPGLGQTSPGDGKPTEISRTETVTTTWPQAPTAEQPAPVVNNYFDLSAVPDAMQSAAGKKAVMNIFKANRDEIRAILGGS